jgi:dUTP pyrophosphatase
LPSASAACSAVTIVPLYHAAMSVHPLLSHSLSLHIQRLSPLAELPSYQSEHAAGMDLHAAIAAPLAIAAGEIRLIPCGFAMAVPEGYEAQVRPRSGLATKFGISMPNAPGTIDADYRGEVKVPLINLGREPFTIEPRMRIAQMVIAPVVRCELLEAEELSATARDANGFGSTGV